MLIILLQFTYGHSLHSPPYFTLYHGLVRSYFQILRKPSTRHNKHFSTAHNLPYVPYPSEYQGNNMLQNSSGVDFRVDVYTYELSNVTQTDSYYSHLRHHFTIFDILLIVRTLLCLRYPRGYELIMIQRNSTSSKWSRRIVLTSPK